SVRVECERFTLVVFCNWRNATTLAGSALAFWDLVAGQRADGADGGRRAALEILTPAARYFAGYLIGSGATVVERFERDDRKQHRTARLVKDVWGAVKNGDEGLRYLKLEKAIEDALLTDFSVDPQIH